jgi:outer membrane protein OmpA-like peptidoglycan-associated protein
MFVSAINFSFQSSILAFMKKIVSFLFSIFFSVLIQAQVATLEKGATKRSKDLFEQADRAIAFGNYKEAVDLLKQATASQSNFIDAWFVLGVLQMENIKDYAAAVISLEKVNALAPNYKPELCFHLGRAYFYNQQYEKSKAVLSTCGQNKLSLEQEKQVELYLKSSDFAVVAMQHPRKFQPRNLGPGINTASDELMPTITADERFIYFTRLDRSGYMLEENIYVSRDSAGAWSTAQMVDAPISMYSYNDGATCISPSGKYLFFTSCERPGGLGNCDIWFAAKNETGFEKPRNLGNKINTPAKDIQPSISADGRTLYFASNRKGGYGGLDIWCSVLQDDFTWSEPKNLGPLINTQFDEERPFIHPDDQTLYFSSDGLPGFGNSDFFVSRKLPNGEWGRPENLGYPINGPGDEIGIVISADGKTAYFASERSDGMGRMDIYSFETDESFKPNYVTYVKGKIFDAETKSPVKANVQLFDLEAAKLYTTLSSDNKGEFMITLPSGKDFAMEVMKEGYLFHSLNFSLKEVKQGYPYYVNVPLQKIKPGQTIVLNNVFYESNLYSLKETSKTELNLVADLLLKNPTLKIEIGGHTDNTGNENHNKILSEKRAKSVFDYLKSKGIDESRITYKGYASSKPVADNDTEEGKAQNRRTEIIVIEI